MAGEESKQLQEIIILLTKRAEAETPLKKGFVNKKLAQYPDELVRRATEEMEGMERLPVIPAPETVADAEDFVLLWQEQRGVFSSVDSLIEAIETWTEHWNDDPHPFVWTKTAEAILAKARRARAALDTSTTNAPHH